MVFGYPLSNPGLSNSVPNLPNSNGAIYVHQTVQPNQKVIAEYPEKGILLDIWGITAGNDDAVIEITNSSSLSEVISIDSNGCVGHAIIGSSLEVTGEIEFLNLGLKPVIVVSLLFCFDDSILDSLEETPTGEDIDPDPELVIPDTINTRNLELYVSDDDGTTLELMTLPSGSVITAIGMELWEEFSVEANIILKIGDREIFNGKNELVLYEKESLDITPFKVNQESKVVGILEYEGYADYGALDIILSWGV